MHRSPGPDLDLRVPSPKLRTGHKRRSLAEPGREISQITDLGGRKSGNAVNGRTHPEVLDLVLRTAESDAQRYSTAMSAPIGRDALESDGDSHQASHKDPNRALI
jgi:hypothetical protein